MKKTALKILSKTLIVSSVMFVGTFVIYMTNADNKLIYRVIRPFLNNHYDKQVRDRRI